MYTINQIKITIFINLLLVYFYNYLLVEEEMEMKV